MRRLRTSALPDPPSPGACRVLGFASAFPDPAASGGQVVRGSPRATTSRVGWVSREPFGPHLGRRTAFDVLGPKKSSDYGERRVTPPPRALLEGRARPSALNVDEGTSSVSSAEGGWRDDFHVVWGSYGGASRLVRSYGGASRVVRWRSTEAARSLVWSWFSSRVAARPRRAAEVRAGWIFKPGRGTASSAGPTGDPGRARVPHRPPKLRG